MCGITGIYHIDEKRIVDQTQLKKMTGIISHRGPDDEGFFINKNVGLGHRRLSIIDLNSGKQPMYNDDKSIVIVFNGEIYNYLELKEELKKIGYYFNTNSDTEVIIKAYEAWGIDCQTKFNGMWAFIIWDENIKRLFISRDRIGEKPLHYAFWDNSLIIGSEIKSIFEYGVPRIILRELTELFLVLGNIPAPFTFFKHLKKLLPGHYLLLEYNNISEKKYWDLPEIDEKDMLIDKDKIYEEFYYLLKDAVKIRMRADVLFGAFLSGGLDSSSIVAIMSEISPNPIETFNVSFKEKGFDESELALLVSKKFKTNHYEKEITPDLFEEALEKIIFYFDEPFGDSSAIPTGYISKFAREKVKMVLTGDGGDEVLSGYEGYQGLKLISMYQKTPHFVNQGIPLAALFLGKYFNGSIRYKLNKIYRVSSVANLSFNNRAIRKISKTDFDLIKSLRINNNFFNIEDYFFDLMKPCKCNDDFYKMMYQHFKHNLPNDYLVKVDRMSMANSLETRLPFLDYRLIEFMVKVDKKIKMQGWERKSVLRKTVGKNLPSSLLKAPKKGFEVPLREWFKAKNFNSLLSTLYSSEWGLNNKIIKSIVDENISGQKDNGHFIWSLFILKRIIEMN